VLRERSELGVVSDAGSRRKAYKLKIREYTVDNNSNYMVM
jgi:hypothetical protein